MPLLTVFTPTYNRAYILPKLYESLVIQTCNDFEWIIVDDGSTDNTEDVVLNFKQNSNNFNIRYFKKENGGKPRAINMGLSLSIGKYFFIVDSDDYLLEDAIEKMKKWINEVDNEDKIVGVGAAIAFPNMHYIKGVPPKIQGEYVDATNLERKNYDLDADMCEAYKVDILKQYPFVVWEGEKFSPEAIVFNDIALDGYKVRWHKDIIYICDYLDDGLTKGNWNLLKSNPMGYAMLNNNTLKYCTGVKNKIYYSAQLIALSIVGHNFSYIWKSNAFIYTVLALPLGIPLSIRRKMQFKK